MHSACHRRRHRVGDWIAAAVGLVVLSTTALIPARAEEPGSVKLVPGEASAGSQTLVQESGGWVAELFNAPQRVGDPARTSPPEGQTGSLPLLSDRNRKSNGKSYPTLEWSGFLQLDTGDVFQDDASEAAIGRIGAQTGLRRVRLRAQGRVREDTWYRVDLDFAASGHPSFRDVGLHLGDVPYVQNIQLGYFRQPFGMDAMSSGRYLLLQERQLPFAFAPFRQTGVGIYGTSDDEATTYAFSLFVFPTDSFGVSTKRDGGASAATRWTHLLIDECDCNHILHIGGGYVFGDPADETVRYRIQPGFFVTDPADEDLDPTVPVIVDTGNVRSTAFHLWNLELAFAYGPWRLQSEGRVALVNQKGGSDLAFPGAYVQIGYVLTGEDQNYDRSQAVFRAITPHEEFQLGTGGSGAWELAFGWSFIDLTDQNIDGGEAHAWTMGVNWYLSRHIKMVLNAGPVFVTNRTVGNSRAFVVSARAQVEF